MTGSYSNVAQREPTEEGLIIIIPIYSRRKQNKLHSVNRWLSDRHAENRRPMSQLRIEKSSPVQRVSD